MTPTHFRSGDYVEVISPESKRRFPVHRFVGYWDRVLREGAHAALGKGSPQVLYKVAREKRWPAAHRQPLLPADILELIKVDEVPCGGNEPGTVSGKSFVAV